MGQDAHVARRGRRRRALSVLSRRRTPSGVRVPQRRGVACERGFVCAEQGMGDVMKPPRHGALIDG